MEYYGPTYAGAVLKIGGIVLSVDAVSDEKSFPQVMVGIGLYIVGEICSAYARKQLLEESKSKAQPNRLEQRVSGTAVEE